MKYELPSTELIVIEENNYLKFGEYLNDMQCDDATNKLCLDDLEYVNKLQQENEQLKAQIKEYQKALDETISKKIDVENNWNKLRECLKDVMNSCDTDDKDFVETILDIMAELEQGSDNQ